MLKLINLCLVFFVTLIALGGSSSTAENPSADDPTVPNEEIPTKKEIVEINPLYIELF